MWLLWSLCKTAMHLNSTGHYGSTRGEVSVHVLLQCSLL